MAYRRTVNIIPRGGRCVCNLWIPHFEKALNVISQTGRFPDHVENHRIRTLHTSTPTMVIKLLSVDELFAKKSLQGYLKKIETQYTECLSAVNGTEELCNEDELRFKKTKLSLLAPLIHNIRELETKQKEIAETEMLLKGENPSNMPRKKKKFRFWYCFFFLIRNSFWQIGGGLWVFNYIKENSCAYP